MRCHPKTVVTAEDVSHTRQRVHTWGGVGSQMTTHGPEDLEKCNKLQILRNNALRSTGGFVWHYAYWVSVYLLNMFLEPSLWRAGDLTPTQLRAEQRRSRQAQARPLPVRYPPPETVTSFSLCLPARKRSVLDDIFFPMH